MRKFSGSVPFVDFGAVTNKKNKQNIKHFAVIQTVIIYQRTAIRKENFKIYELNIKTYTRFAIVWFGYRVMLFATMKKKSLKTKFEKSKSWTFFG